MSLNRHSNVSFDQEPVRDHSDGLPVCMSAPHRLLSRNLPHAVAFGMRISSASLAFVALIVLSARIARGQGVGFQGGVAVDPSQVYAGTHAESSALAGRVYFRPSLDGSFGSGVKDAIMDVTFTYKFPISNLSPWSLYEGARPVVTIERLNDEIHVHGGLGAVFGFANRNGFFAEFKVSGGGGPNLRFGIGYTVRRPQP